MPKHKNKDVYNTGYFIALTAKYIKLAGSKGLRENKLENLTLEQYGLLFALHFEDGLYQRQLSKALLKDRPNITRLVSILKKIGMVEKIRDEENKKIFKIYLTKKGREEIERLIPIRNKFFNDAFRGISKKDINSLLTTLKRVRDNLCDTFTIQT